MPKRSYLPILLRILGALVIGILLLWWLIARPALVSKVEPPVIPITEDELRNHVIFLSETVLPRDSEHPENLQKAADYIAAELRPYAANIELQTYIAEHKSYSNVVAAFGPDTRDLLVVGAHYDAYSSFPGADDNASGVAGLLALGKLLSKASLQQRVLLVAYTLEEPPFYASESMGSFVHAQSLKGKTVSLMISLEMIGYFTNAKGSQSYPVPLLHLFYPSAGNFIAVVDQLSSQQAAPLKNAINKYTQVPAYSINAPAWIPGVDFSDHRSYWHFGYPAVMVTDTAFYRNHQYHEENDTYSRLDYTKMKEVVWGIYQYLLEAAKK